MFEFSTLNKTWILDIDGTILKHNGYSIDKKDTLLEGVSEFFKNISPNDKVILLTARKNENIEELKTFLKENNIRYDFLLSDMPHGERILINDKKPSGLKTAYAINKNRDEIFELNYTINKDL